MVRVFALASIVEALASADVRTVGVLCATVVVVAVLTLVEQLRQIVLLLA